MSVSVLEAKVAKLPPLLRRLQPIRWFVYVVSSWLVGYSLNQLYLQPMGSTVFIIPSDIIKSSGYCPQILYTSSGIINPVDPLASAYNLYFLSHS